VSRFSFVRGYLPGGIDLAEDRDLDALELQHRDVDLRAVDESAVAQPLRDRALDLVRALSPAPSEADQRERDGAGLGNAFRSRGLGSGRR
jgi:hypothetical protein